MQVILGLNENLVNWLLRYIYFKNFILNILINDIFYIWFFKKWFCFCNDFSPQASQFSIYFIGRNFRGEKFSQYFANLLENGKSNSCENYFLSPIAKMNIFKYSEPSISQFFLLFKNVHVYETILKNHWNKIPVINQLWPHLWKLIPTKQKKIAAGRDKKISPNKVL